MLRNKKVRAKAILGQNESNYKILKLWAIIGDEGEEFQAKGKKLRGDWAQSMGMALRLLSQSPRVSQNWRE